MIYKHFIFFLLISLFLIFDNSFSQVPPYFNYTTKEGLCNSNVYYILQDKTGYMWFVTNNGLSRFDGRTFNNYFTSDSLNSNSFTGIAEGEDSTIYFSTYDRGINYYKNGVFGNYKNNSDDLLIIHQFQSYKDTLFLYGSSTLGYIYLNKLHFDNYPNIDIKYSLFINPQGTKYLGTETGLYTLKGFERIKANVKGLKNEGIYKITGDRNGNLWLGGYGKIYKVKDNKVVETIVLKNGVSEKVYKILVDKFDNVWFHPVNKGLFLYKNGEITDIGKKINLGTTPVTHISEDKEGNIWVSTSGKGVFCFNNLYINNYFASDGLLNNNITSILSITSGNTLIGTFNGLNLFNGITFLKNDNFNNANITNFIYEIKKGFEDNYIISCTFLKSFVLKSNIAGTDITYLHGVSGLEDSKDNFILGSNTNSISYFSGNSNKYYITDTSLIFGKDVKYVRVNEIEKDNSGNLWVGTNHGLCRILNSNKIFYTDNIVLNSSITSIKIDNQERVWITAEKGFSLIIPPDHKIITFVKANEFDFSSANSLDFDNTGNVWIGTNKGLYRISERKILEENIDSALFFNESNGLPSSETHSISFNNKNNCIWVGTLNGLAKINLNEICNYIQPPPKIQINSIELADTTIAFQNDLSLEPSQNNIRLKLTALSYGSPASLYFEYKFEDDNHWIDLNSHSLEFASLAPGNYKLQLRTENSSHLKSDITKFNFKIRAPFWRTSFFYFSSIFSFAVLFTFIFFKRVRTIKKRAQEKIDTENSISMMKYQALSESMNPHFIFNALNTIQYYFNFHSSEEANNSLVNFAQLIRMNFDLGGDTFISLASEIVRLELYLKYENLRFEDKMKYKIEIFDDIDSKKLLIPNMILQPFVENSIWHGLLPKGGNGLINIEVTNQTELIFNNKIKTITIKIIDDGIGLTESAKYKKATHNSKGVSITKEKLKLLVPEIKNMEFIKIQDRDDNTTGTSVKITLVPGQYKFE